MSEGTRAGGAAERSGEAPSVKAMKANLSSPFFPLPSHTMCSYCWSFSSFLLGLGPRVPCHETPLSPAAGGRRGHFVANPATHGDDLGGFGGALNHPAPGSGQPLIKEGQGGSFARGRVAHECHLQDCRYLEVVTRSRLGAAPAARRRQLLCRIQTL